MIVVQGSSERGLSLDSQLFLLLTEAPKVAVFTNDHSELKATYISVVRIPIVAQYDNYIVPTIICTYVCRFILAHTACLRCR